MCIVLGKYFEGIGWVAAKNRDRNYIPNISFKKKEVDGTEILYFWDDVTQYCEGLNSAGVGVLSASLMVLDDEKEIKDRSKKPSKDGIRIKKALQYPSVKAVAASLIKQELTGNTLIFDSNTMYLLEGAFQPGRKYVYKIKEIPQNETVARTNHGIWIPWAGYQISDNKAQTMSRYSSESRLTIAELTVKYATEPEDMIDNLTLNFTGHGQMNALRTTTEKKKMRTTSQILIIPSEKTMYVRPVQSNINFNFWNLNNPKQNTWIEILSNRILYKNLRDNETDNDLPFIGKLSHEIHK